MPRHVKKWKMKDMVQRIHGRTPLRRQQKEIDLLEESEGKLGSAWEDAPVGADGEHHLPRPGDRLVLRVLLGQVDGVRTPD